MHKLSILFFVILFSISLQAKPSDRVVLVERIIEAVNEKSPEKYIAGFADDVVVKLYDGEVKVEGKQSLFENRSKHLKKFPKAYSEIQHLVEIDNKVIMHDKVWLNGKDGESSDIVEVFTFDNNGLIFQVDVIQQSDLLKK